MEDILTKLSMVLLLAGLFFGLGYYVHKIRTENAVKPTIPITVNLDSLHNIWAQGQPFKIRIDTLRKIIKDTSWLPSIPETLYTAGAWAMDSTFDDSVNIKLKQKDSLISGATKVTLGLDFIGEPFYLFHLRSLSIAPITLDIPIEEKIIYRPRLFSLNILAGGNKNNAGGGLQLQIYKFGIGSLYQLRQSPFYFGSYRVGF